MTKDFSPARARRRHRIVAVATASVTAASLGVSLVHLATAAPDPTATLQVSSQASHLVVFSVPLKKKKSSDDDAAADKKGSNKKDKDSDKKAGKDSDSEDDDSDDDDSDKKQLSSGAIAGSGATSSGAGSISGLGTTMQPTESSAPAASSACVTPPGMTHLLDQDASDEQLPWKRNGADKVTIYYAVGSVSPEWRADLQHGSDDWNRSPCLDTHLVVACPTGANCVNVSVVTKGDDGNFDAVEQGGYTTGGHIELLDSLSTNQKRNVAVHEMGHSVGLLHRKTKHVLMDPDTLDDVFDPDTIDYQNLLFDYGQQLQGSQPAGS